MSNPDDESGEFDDASLSSLSRLRGVDIPEDLAASRHFRDKLADIAEQYPDSNPANLLMQVPHMTGAFVAAVMELEMKLNALQKRLDS
ncbi:MAG: hypothetical protein ACRDTK_17720 [Mycobacterium sp.]